MLLTFKIRGQSEILTYLLPSGVQKPPTADIHSHTLVGGGQGHASGQFRFNNVCRYGSAGGVAGHLWSREVTTAALTRVSQEAGDSAWSCGGMPITGSFLSV